SPPVIPLTHLRRGADAPAEMACCALRRLGACRVRLRVRGAGTGAGCPLSARRSSRHQRNALTGEPNTEPQLAAGTTVPLLLGPPRVSCLGEFPRVRQTRKILHAGRAVSTPRARARDGSGWGPWGGPKSGGNRRGSS